MDVIDPYATNEPLSHCYATIFFFLNHKLSNYVKTISLKKNYVKTIQLTYYKLIKIYTFIF